MRPIYLISKTPFPGVIHLPVLRIQFLTPKIDFSRYQGIIATSKEAIKALTDYPDNWKRLRCLCVSEATGAFAKEAGALDVVNAGGYGDLIPEMMAKNPDIERWLYLRPYEIASQWPEDARRSGMNVDEVIVYQTECNEALDMVRPEADGVLIFTSPSSIECFRKRYEILPTQDVVVIGTTTQQALPEKIKSVLSDIRTVSSAVDKAREIAQS